MIFHTFATMTRTRGMQASQNPIAVGEVLVKPCVWRGHNRILRIEAGQFAFRALQATEGSSLSRVTALKPVSHFYQGAAVQSQFFSDGPTAYGEAQQEKPHLGLES